MKSYDLIVFDWDGTLMDSANEIVGAMQQAIQDLGLPERTPAQMRELIGLGLEDVLARLFPDLDPRRLRDRLRRYRDRYGWPRSQARLFPSVYHALEELQALGYQLAVATGKSRRGLNAAMAATDSARFFGFSRCADESAPKPAPDMLEDLLIRTATLPEKALMVGDTEYDMAMARAAGVDAVGLSWGVHDAQRLRLAGALTVLEGVAQLPAWISPIAD